MTKTSTYTKQVEQSKRFQAKKQGAAFNDTYPVGDGILFNGVAFEYRRGNYYAKGWDGTKVLNVTGLNALTILDHFPKGWRVLVNGDTHYVYPTLNEALKSASLYCK